MYATILLTTVPALVMESTVEGDISDFTIQIGGRASRFGLICGVCFVVYDLFRAAHRRRTLGDTITDKHMVFFDLSELEIRYGIRGVWSKSYSSALVSRIAFAGQSVHFYIPGTQLLVTTAMFDPVQLAEMKSYFAEVRETVEPGSFFNWRRRAGGLRKAKELTQPPAPAGFDELYALRGRKGDRRAY